MVSGVAIAESTRTPGNDATNALMESRLRIGLMPGSKRIPVAV
jgi:hypothetical protein